MQMWALMLERMGRHGDAQGIYETGLHRPLPVRPRESGAGGGEIERGVGGEGEREGEREGESKKGWGV